MRINWISYYHQHNGFGRFSSKLVQALQSFGIDVKHLTVDDLQKPQWMLDQMGVSWDNLNITCLDLAQITKAPGRHWLYTMCEGPIIPKAKIKKIKKSNIERLLVPSTFCAHAFEDAGIHCPVDVLPLGTDPGDFPIAPKVDRPYTFLALADRNQRKGWQEAYEGFYKAFGGRTTGNKDVRLIIKCLPHGNPLLDMIVKKTDNLDSRIKIDISLYKDMADFYQQGDCFVIPSRSEGWGMPQREAAMMGLPVIVQPIAGLDEPYLEQWAIVLPQGKMEEMPRQHRLGGLGNWMVADPRRVAEEMRYCYENQADARAFGLHASNWLTSYQTYMHSAANLIELIDKEVGDGRKVENPTYNGVPRNGRRILRSSYPIGEVRSA